MARELAKVVGALLLLALGACGGCAGRRAADEAAPAPATPAATAAVELPEDTPVPPELACSSDAECVATPFARAVESAGACYCPGCPAPLSTAAAATNEAAWQAQCGAAWADRRACEAPMCRRPPPVVCRDGACAFAAP